MTRTERASHPRALVKDRSESKSGLDKRVQKNGAGAHGWGSLADEVAHEMLDDDQGPDSDTEAAPVPATASAPIAVRRSSGEPTEAEKEAARKVRQQALKDGQVDLGSIARTSAAVSHSPPKTAPIAAAAADDAPQVQ